MPSRPGVQQDRERQVGVARRVGAAQLHPRGLLLAGVVERHPHQRRAVAARPGGVDRRLVARHQALVGVDPLGEHRAHLARVAQLAGDERLADGREVELVVGVVEGVGAVLEQRHVGVHPRAVLAEQRLGHEGGVPAVLHGVLLDRDAVGHAVVRHLQRRRRSACRSRAGRARPRGGCTPRACPAPRAPARCRGARRSRRPGWSGRSSRPRPGSRAGRARGARCGSRSTPARGPR